MSKKIQAARLPDPPGRFLEGLHRHPLPGRDGSRSRPLQGGHERHGKWTHIDVQWDCPRLRDSTVFDVVHGMLTSHLMP